MAFRKSYKDDPADWVVVGLGNPGEKYDETRHNVGWAACNLLAERHGLSWRQTRQRSIVGVARIGDQRVMVAKPLTFMNLSGEAVKPLLQTAGAGASQLLVVHDELDLALGTVRIKRGGGFAGHNGVSSVANVLKTRDFLRVRMGIGRDGNVRGKNFVLGRFAKDERDDAEIMFQDAADAVEAIVTDGVDAAQMRIHSR